MSLPRWNCTVLSLGGLTKEAKGRLSERLGVIRGRGRLPKHRLLEQLDGAVCVVGEREHLVELDLRLHAVALDDPFEPRPGIEGLRIPKRLPLINAARPSPFAPYEVLAN